MDEELLASIYAAPDDDAPRLVYSDVLLERGDPFGEFIQLQIARANGQRDTREREKQLFEQHGLNWWSDHPYTRMWWRPRSPLVHSERGFPSKFELLSHTHASVIQETDERLAQLVGLPGWSTIRNLELHDSRKHGDAIETLLNRSPLVSLRIMSHVWPALLERIAGALLPVEALGVSVLPGERLPRITGFPKLHSLYIGASEVTLDDGVRVALQSGICERIEHLTFALRYDTLAAVIAAYHRVPLIKSFTMANDYYQLMLIRGVDSLPSAQMSVFRPEAVDGIDALPVHAVASLHVAAYRDPKQRELPLRLEGAVARWGASGCVRWTNSLSDLLLS
jgi:uncharacterized protein (TIGR02996 family)